MIRLIAVALLSITAAACAVTPQSPKAGDAPPQSTKVCGGLAGATCAMDEWCDYADEAACGYGDAEGTCRPRPEACTMQYDPVCGCDGKTHGSACQASSVGVDITMRGECALKSDPR